MNDDLSDAKAAIEWARTQLPTLTSRIAQWKSDSHKIGFGDVNHHTGKKPVKLREVNIPSPIINAEIGVIINSIRSSLDILSTTLFHRHNMASSGIREEEVYFPVPTHSYFISGEFIKKSKRAKFIQALPARERGLIELYYSDKGRNDILFTLHNLDILRKHRRLLTVSWEPTGIVVSGTAWIHGIDFLPQWPGFENDAIIAFARQNATESDINIAVDIFFDQAPLIPVEPVLTTLTNFADFTDSIIDLFN